MNNDFDFLDLMTDQQKNTLRVFNQTQRTLPEQATLTSIFYEQAEKHRNTIAVSFKEESLTYAELNKQSNQVAHLLHQIGVQPGHIVAVFMNRSLDTYIAILAILKVGAAYLPVDPDNPEERIQYILTNSNISAVLTKSQFLSFVEDYNTRFAVTLDRLKSFQRAKKRGGKVFDKEDIARSHDNDLPLKNGPEDLAYIIYTSGSTGKPKGVMVEHRSVVNLVYWAQEVFELTSQSHVIQHYSIAFDPSAQEMFPAWSCGATLYPVPEDILVNPPQFVQWLNDNAISFWDTIPSLWYQIVNYVNAVAPLREITLPYLKVLVLGGEILHTEKVNNWITCVKPRHKIINIYGPTEATVNTTFYIFSDHEEQKTVPIGKPLYNVEVYILGEDFRQCMPNTEGEIYIGGVCLARGYLNSEELSHVSFVSIDLMGKEKRLYKTGDFGKLLSDGNLEFIGRQDEQVKVRGYRIELLEVELALRSCPSVNSAVVLVKDEESTKKIIAYYTTSDAELSVDTIRNHVKAKIPSYMIPHHFMKITEMPVTTTNKIDKMALLHMASDSNLQQGEVYQGPVTKTEKLLARIWKDVLHIDNVSVNDNFFAVGGDSILIIMIRHQCELEGIRLSTVELFQHPTIKSLARYIDEHLRELQFSNVARHTQKNATIQLSPEQQKLLPKGATVILPLLPLQLTMLYESILYGNAVSIPQQMLHCAGYIDKEAFERALNVLIERHEAFRTVFRTDITPQPVQVVLSNVNYQLSSYDISDQSWQQQDDYVKQETIQQRKQGFDLAQWPLFQFTVYQRSDTRFDILWTMHHIIMDGWSTSILYKELRHIYSMLVTQKFLPLPQQKSNFSDYVISYLCRDFTKAKAFWQKYLSNVEPLALPKDFTPGNELGLTETISVSLSEECTTRLKNFARQNQVTLNMVCLTAYFLFLKYNCQQDDLVIGIVTSTRSEGVEGIVNIVGNLVNTIPLRINVGNVETIEEILSMVKRNLFALQPHDFLGLADISSLISQTASQSLVETLFVFENYPSAIDLGASRSFQTFEVLKTTGSESNSLPLTVVSYENRTRQLVFNFNYASNLFRKETISAWARLYLTICEEFGQAEALKEI